MKNQKISNWVNLKEILEWKFKEFKILKEINDKIRNRFNEFKSKRNYHEIELKILEIRIFWIDYYKDFKYEENLKKDINAVWILLYKTDEKIKDKVPKKNWNNFIDQDLVLNYIKISEVVLNYTDIKSVRKNIKCPFHKDKSPSMKLYQDTNSFYCFSCWRAGNVINFIQQIEWLSFYESLKFLQNNYL